MSTKGPKSTFEQDGITFIYDELKETHEILRSWTLPKFPAKEQELYTMLHDEMKTEDYNIEDFIDFFEQDNENKLFHLIHRFIHFTNLSTKQARANSNESNVSDLIDIQNKLADFIRLERLGINIKQKIQLLSHMIEPESDEKNDRRKNRAF